MAIDWRRRSWTLHQAAMGSRCGTPDDIRFLTLAMAGEAGEAANVVKKQWRADFGMGGDFKSYEEFVDKLAEELVDTQAYCLLIAKVLGIDLEKEALRKQLEVERRPQYQSGRIIVALQELGDDIS